MTDSTIQYGIRTGSSIQWPDTDGDLNFEAPSGRSYETGDTAHAEVDEAVLISRTPKGSTLVKREVTYGAPRPVVEVPLPTELGSVVRVTYEGSRVTAILADTDDFPWRLPVESLWARPGELTDVEVLFDAATAE